MATAAALLPSSSLMFIFVLLLLQSPEQSHGQQSYVNNRQLGFVCNAPAAFCSSYLTFRSTPTYNNPATIAYLLSADANQIAAVNNVSDVDRLPDDTLVVVPVNCNCYDGNYYQHNASYVLRHAGETYFTVANDIYQALTTYQSMEAQNPNHPARELFTNLSLAVPLRCACPTRNQTAAGFNYLLTYLISQGDNPNSIAQAFSGAGTTVQGILDANELTANQTIYFFTPLLVPLRLEPTKENINTAALPHLPPPSPPTIPTAQSSNSNSSRGIFIGVGIGAAVLVLFSLGFLFWWLSFRHRRRQSPPQLFPPTKEYSGNEKSSAAEPPSSDYSMPAEGIRNSIDSLTVYNFNDLEKTTDSFSEANRINGSSVYRGSFRGDPCAVKIMKGDVSREIGLLRQINHSHIIRLSGFCLHQGSTYLVYEYAQNRALSDWLHPPNSPRKNTSKYLPIIGLDWKQRVQIAYDIADALNYLHNFTNPPYIHNNLKSSNVLLDSNMRAKVANFGLARFLDTDGDEAVLTRHVVGTYGYMALEYAENGLVTPKIDVFAFGVVMLELLSGKEPILDVKGKEDDELLLYEVIGRVLGGENVREKLREFMDPGFGEEYPLELAYAMAQLARSCVARDFNARPLVSEVFMALTKILSSSMDWDPSHELKRSRSFSPSDEKMEY